MHRLLLALFTLVIISCQGKRENSVQKVEEESEAIALSDSITTLDADSIDLLAPDTISNPGIGNTSQEAIRPQLIKLLKDPIDLKKYKKRKRGANSSTRMPNSYDYTPDTVGHHFYYFWFHELRRRYRSEAASTDAVVIKSYIYGKEIGWYSKVDEALIGLKCRIEDEDLGQLNLVGKDTDYLNETYGLVQTQEFMLGAHQGLLLLLHINNEKVDWFRYRRTNLDINGLDDVPSELRQYGNRLD